MKKAFLIDFENVKSAGLLGLEELDAADDIVILYSANSNTISFEMHQQILHSRACVDYYQIRRGGKNSLDFQLASLLGYLLGTGEYSHIYIVSNDTGFDVLRDFWTSGFVPNDCVVYRRGTVAACLAHSQCVPRPFAQEEDAADFEQMQQEPAVAGPVLEEEPAPQLVPQAPEQVVPEQAEPELPLQPAQPEAPEALEEPAPQPPEAEAPAVQPADPAKIQAVQAALPQALCDMLNEDGRRQVATLVVKAGSKQDFYRHIITAYGQKKGLEIYKNVKSEYTSLKKL